MLEAGVCGHRRCALLEVCRKLLETEAVMNEIQINALSRSLGVDKTFSNSKQRAAEHTGERQKDTVQLSRVPDLSAIEAALEDEFASIRTKLEAEAESPSYPPLETIDRLAGLFAMNLKGDADPF